MTIAPATGRIAALATCAIALSLGTLMAAGPASAATTAGPARLGALAPAGHSVGDPTTYYHNGNAVTAPPVTSSTVSPATACTGQTPYIKTLTTPAHTATEHGFFFSNGRQVCVGQANLRENFNDSTGLAERVRVRDGGASGPLIFQTFNNSGSGAGTGTLDFTTHVNMLFNTSQVTVCVALVNQSDHSVVDNVDICKTLP